MASALAAASHSQLGLTSRALVLGHHIANTGPPLCWVASVTKLLLQPSPHRQNCLTMFCIHMRVCSGLMVCHSCPAASPFVFKCDQPQEQLVDVAVNGTHNVLSSVVKNKESIKRVLVTSSFAGGPMCAQDGAV